MSRESGALSSPFPPALCVKSGCTIFANTAQLAVSLVRSSTSAIVRNAMANPYLLPDNQPKGRPYSTATRLGRVMRLRGHTNVYEFAAKVQISPRQMTYYLSGEHVIPMHHLIRLSEELDCPAELLQEP